MAANLGGGLVQAFGEGATPAVETQTNAIGGLITLLPRIAGGSRQLSALAGPGGPKRRRQEFDCRPAHGPYAPTAGYHPYSDGMYSDGIMRSPWGN